MNKLYATLIAVALIGTSYNPRQSHVPDMELVIKETLANPTSSWRDENTTLYFERNTGGRVGILFADNHPFAYQNPDRLIGKEDLVKIDFWNHTIILKGKEPVAGYKVLGEEYKELPIQETRRLTKKTLKEMREIIESQKQRMYAGQ